MPPTTPRPGRPYGRKTPDERRGDRRARLMATATEAFGTVGYRGTSIEALCAGAGVSTRNFYEEFPSREDLLIAVHDEINARAHTAVVATLGEIDPDDLLARARAATRAYLDVMTSDRRLARIALVESVGVSPKVEAARQAAIDRFVALIELESNRLADTGVVARRNFALTAVALAGALNGMVNTWSANADWEAQVPAIAEEAARLIVLGITAPELP
jgi:AcrR family transcriptional regulator